VITKGITVLKKQSLEKTVTPPHSPVHSNLAACWVCEAFVFNLFSLQDMETDLEFSEASTLSKQTVLCTTNLAKYKLEIVPKTQQGGQATACTS
jgi:hypothetical protein